MLVDTAGAAPRSQLHADPTEAQKLAEEQLRQAELELFCLDATRPVNSWERATLEQNALHARLVVWTKIDAGSPQEEFGIEQLRTSNRSGAGIEQLRARIRQLLSTSGVPEAAVVASTAERCRVDLEAADRHLDTARRLLAREEGEELVAFEMREALEKMGRVVGAVYTDDILDRVFQRFCIGK